MKTMSGNAVPERVAQVAKGKRRDIIIDVGGERFTASRNIIETFPATRLGRLVRADTIDKILELCDEFTPGETPEYFFDRNPDNFGSILNMYR